MDDRTKSTSTISTFEGWPATNRKVRAIFEAFNDYGEIALLSFALFYNTMLYITLRSGSELPASLAPVCCLLWVLSRRVIWPAGLPRKECQLSAGTQSLTWEEREEHTAWARRYKVRRYTANGVNCLNMGLAVYEIVRMHAA